MAILDKVDETFVNQSIEKGIKYLLSNTADGRWRGFPTLAGESDIWVTGFILAHIEKLCKSDDIELALDFLIKAQQQSNGWSYNTIVPSDADSTAWCIMALKSSKLNGTGLERAKLFLWSHYNNSGISTYRIDSGILEFISAPNIESIQGWTSSHPDVTIAAILADIQNAKVPEILNWLMNQKLYDGFIDSYWWRSPFYTTTLLLRALKMRKETLPNEHVRKIHKNVSQKQFPNGGFGIDTSTELDPFTTALALEALVYLTNYENNTKTHLCAKSLVKSQNEDGSWGGDYILRIPAPNILDPKQVQSWSFEHGGGNSMIKDQNGLFATAMSCYALNCYKQSEKAKSDKYYSQTSQN